MSGDPRVPAREDCVLRHLLERRAAEAPDQTFLLFDGGEAWTHAELLAEARATAAGLQDLGVRQGDHVVCWLPNGREILRFWFAVNYLGGVFVPINTAYRGGLLAHVLRNSDARLAIADARLVPRLRELEDRGDVETVAVVGPEPGEVPGLELIDAAAVRSARPPDPPDRPVEPWDTQAIVYTSGTTGPSKGVLSSYAQAYAMYGPTTMPFMSASDRYLINLPMFHVGGTTQLYSMLIHGGSAAVVEAFSGERFWSQIRTMGCTVVVLLGVMATFIERRPAQPDDADNPLEKVLSVPLVDDVAGFSRRFGVDVYSIYNMTEISSPLITDANPTLRGTCGRVRPGAEVRLVDEHDCEVPVGEVGEILVRTDAPWALNHGYHKMPEATARAWRNGWFHTGDAARRDEDGNFFFVDRLKDAIRRRGENISSMEVETEIVAHPAVREAAVIAVPSEIAEDEVMAIVAPVPGRRVDPAELTEFLVPRMAYYMVPRYVRVVDDLPKTPTSKVQKNVLRDDGVTEDTWDRQAAGIVVARERFT